MLEAPVKSRGDAEIVLPPRQHRATRTVGLAIGERVPYVIDLNKSQRDVSRSVQVNAAAGAISEPVLCLRTSGCRQSYRTRNAPASVIERYPRVGRAYKSANEYVEGTEMPLGPLRPKQIVVIAKMIGQRIDISCSAVAAHIGHEPKMRGEIVFSRGLQPRHREMAAHSAFAIGQKTARVELPVR